MAFTHTISTSFARNGDTIAKSVAKSGSSEQAVDTSFATATTDGVIDVDFVYGDLRSLYLVSDQAVTAQFVRASDDNEFVTVNLAANVPYVWQYGGYAANPFNADVKELHITNASGSTANISLRVLTV